MNNNPKKSSEVRAFAGNEKSTYKSWQGRAIEMAIPAFTEDGNQ